MAFGADSGHKQPVRTYVPSLVAFLLIHSTLAYAAPAARAIARPLPHHPGNIFLSSEEVTVPWPTARGPWQLVDYESGVVARGPASTNVAALGRLPVGWYELRPDPELASSTNGLSLAVLAPLRAPTPRSSPVSLDVAMAWFYPAEQMPNAASLCSLAGVNWVRDRLAWPEVEASRGQFAANTRYDSSARAQAAAGLRQLQVNHSSPGWANPRTGRFPVNLRDAYSFYREAARRWRDAIEAFEPWNEADIEMFGGHTGSELASFQKATYLGLKAGNPKVIACQNVFADHVPAILEDYHANEAWAFFDTFNLHHYAAFDAFPKVYADFRAISAGKPLWVTECSVPVRWSGDERIKEPSPGDLRVQSERVARVFATALHEGPSTVFYFLLPHYVEGQTQFGIVRPDLTPRPAYLALAAVGRLLADAKPLGRLRTPAQNARAFLFNARPDGEKREVLVAWAAEGACELNLPARPLAAFDHLGRATLTHPMGDGPVGQALQLTAAPLFLVFPPGTARKLPLSPPPSPPPLLAGKPCPIVLGAQWPKDRVLLRESAYRLAADRAETVPLRVYNFSDRRVRGRLAVWAPAGWVATCPAEVALEANTDQELSLALECRVKAPDPAPARVVVTGDFAGAGRSLLSLRFKLDTR
jgi:hypothetical protein